MAVGESVIRVDGASKVTGRARYTADDRVPGTRVAKYLRSTISHGYVTRIDTTKAKALPGIDGVFTFEDVPDIRVATAGHAFQLNPAERDVEDRLLLTGYVRYHGDEIAIVVGENNLVVEEALRLIEVEYDELPPILTAADALAEGAKELHEGSKNLVGEHEYHLGDIDQGFSESDLIIEEELTTQMVQHVHMENHIARAWMDDMDHVVIVSSTQIPHICRRVVGQALDFPWTKVRVIKPYIGGGFGNKQDVVLEPMVAFLTMKLGGLPVEIDLPREECLIGTRMRHPMVLKAKVGVTKDGTLKSLHLDVTSNTGAYASHGHAIVKASGSKLAPLYPRANMLYHAKTHYANIPACGAMRGYGSPQLVYGVDSTMESAARALNMDPVDFRLKNVAHEGDLNKLTGHNIVSCGISECLTKGRELFNWDEKRAQYADQEGPIRRGVGVSVFSYGSGTYPAGVEIASCRLSLQQDGRVILQVGATEIGQGSDTVFAQMAAETTGIDFDQFHVVSTQDTDVTAYDPGAFGSRQSYVVSNAVFKAATELREKVLNYAAEILEKPVASLNIAKRAVIDANSGEVLVSLNDLSMDAFYNKNRGGQLIAEASTKTMTNAYAYGCCFAEVEVDIELCQVKILNILNVHDSGKILNPLLATTQVHGGMGMGIAGAMAEEMLVNEETGKILNNTLLDYKVPTTLDTPDLQVAFVETEETTVPYNHKSIGEPPLLPPAPALRNAIWHATGVKINELPMSPKCLFRHFREAGLV